MAVATKYSDRFASGLPINGRVSRPIGGIVSDIGKIATMEADDVGDFNAFVAAPTGAEIQAIWVDFGDNDSGTTITGDIILRTFDKDGNATDTVLVALTTLMQAALKTFYLINKVKVPESRNGYGLIGVKVTAARTGGGAVDNFLRASWS